MLDKQWVIGSDPIRQPRYQSVGECAYWPILRSFNNCNIIPFGNKTSTNKYFDAVHKVVLYGISDNMYSLVQNGKYGVTTTADTIIMVYYVVKLLSET